MKDKLQTKFSTRQYMLSEDFDIFIITFTARNAMYTTRLSIGFLEDFHIIDSR